VKLITTLHIHKLLVALGIFGVVLPAIWGHLITGLMLIFASPVLWLSYIIGWWGLISLLRIFLTFIRKKSSVGPFTFAGIIAASITVTIIYFSFSMHAYNCASCSQSKSIFPYPPNLLCVLVALHWSYLYRRDFRLIKNLI